MLFTSILQRARRIMPGIDLGKNLCRLCCERDIRDKGIAIYTLKEVIV